MHYEIDVTEYCHLLDALRKALILAHEGGTDLDIFQIKRSLDNLIRKDYAGVPMKAQEQMNKDFMEKFAQDCVTHGAD